MAGGVGGGVFSRMGPSARVSPDPAPPAANLPQGRPRPGWREAAAGMKGGGGGGEERASRERERARQDWHRARAQDDGTARGREGGGAFRETRSQFRKSEVELAISVTLRATGDRGNTFAIRPRSQRVCAGLFAYWTQKLSKRGTKQGLWRPRNRTEKPGLLLLQTVGRIY